MKYVILIVDNSYNLEEMKRLIPNSMISNINIDDKINTLYIQLKSENTITIKQMNEVINDYDNEEIMYIKNILKPTIYVMNYDDVREVKLVLKYIANRSDVLIDNDYSVLVNGIEFNKLCEENPKWDWSSAD